MTSKRGRNKKRSAPNPKLSEVAKERLAQAKGAREQEAYWQREQRDKKVNVHIISQPR